jgi:hypothetical protein
MNKGKVYLGILFTFIFILIFKMSWADSITLMNNSTYTLQATIYDANGKLLGQFVLNPNNATLWSSNYDENWGAEDQYIGQTPYTVSWACMNGSFYGTCNNVAAGSVVTAQSCGGAQECEQQQEQSLYE